MAFFHLDGRLTAHLFGACALCHVLLHTVSESFWGSCHQEGGSSQQLPFLWHLLQVTWASQL